MQARVLAELEVDDHVAPGRGVTDSCCSLCPRRLRGSAYVTDINRAWQCAAAATRLTVHIPLHARAAQHVFTPAVAGPAHAGTRKCAKTALNSLESRPTSVCAVNGGHAINVGINQTNVCERFT